VAIVGGAVGIYAYVHRPLGPTFAYEFVKVGRVRSEAELERAVEVVARRLALAGYDDVDVWSADGRLLVRLPNRRDPTRPAPFANLWMVATVQSEPTVLRCGNLDLSERAAYSAITAGGPLPGPLMEVSPTE
jgi:hypothetical protein